MADKKKEEGFFEKTASALSGAAQAAGNVAVNAVLTENEKKISAKTGLVGSELTYFRAESSQNPALKGVFGKMENELANSPKYDKFLAAMGQRFKAEAVANKESTSGTTIIDLIGKDIQKNPALATKLEAAIRNNPDALAAKIKDYKEGQLEVTLAEVSTPAAAPAAVVANKVAAPAAAPATKRKHNSAPSSSSQAPVQEAESVKETKPSSPAVNPMEAILDGFLTNDKELLQNRVNNTIDAKSVVGIADKMSNEATKKFGVEPAIADAFAKKIKGDPVLAEKISDNLKRNPEFLQELAKASKNKEELKGSTKDMAKSIMTNVMENPEAMKDDIYIKNLTSKIKMGNSNEGGMGSFFGGLMDKFPFLGQLMEAFKNIIRGFTGDNSVLSMSNKGGSMFPTLMINMDNYNKNVTEGRIFDSYKPSDMKAFPVAGADKKIFHTEKYLAQDENGKQIEKTREVPNTVSIVDAKGNPHKIIPSIGLAAVQKSGSYEGGRWKEGNISIVAVTDIDSKGNAAKIERVTMTSEQFSDYKKTVEGMSGSQYPVNASTEADFAKQHKELSDRVATVSPQNGQIGSLQQPAAQAAGQVVQVTPAKSLDEIDRKPGFAGV